MVHSKKSLILFSEQQRATNPDGASTVQFGLVSQPVFVQTVTPMSFRDSVQTRHSSDSTTSGQLYSCECIQVVLRMHLRFNHSTHHIQTTTHTTLQHCPFTSGHLLLSHLSVLTLPTVFPHTLVDSGQPIINSLCHVSTDVLGAVLL